MLFSYNWIKEYIDRLPSAKELCDALTMTGTEVESIAEAPGAVKNVVTAEVVSCAQHPNADRLSLCEVKTDKAAYSIVCGARNMKPGDRVALALIGAELPGGVKIKRSKIRGVESQGMMCSEVELGIKDTSEGIMILSGETPLGVDINEVLGLKDCLLGVNVTPNRADLLSIRGLGREIAAVTGASFKDKDIKVEEGGKQAKDLVSVTIEPDASCARYAARAIEGVKAGPSPDFIRKRLEDYGIRPINNVVDVTNYVMVEYGQPLHAFDFDKVGGRAISVRLAKNGESLTTIDGKTRTLDSSMLVIADANGPVALAGVMGGRPTEVSDSTVNVLLESAWFEPASVRRTSRKTGLSSESSYRFERGVDIECVTKALDAAAGLIQKLAGGTVAKGIVDVYPRPFRPAEISFRVRRAGDLLGVELREDGALQIFGRLGIAAKPSGNGVVKALQPSFRVDIKDEIDLVEEAARIYGYDRVPAGLPLAPLRTGEAGRRMRVLRKIKEILTNAGLSEAVSFSFVSRPMFGLTGTDKKGIEILNPITEDQIVMRDSLIPSLLETLKLNLSRKNEEVRIFEAGPAFTPGEGELPVERWKVSALIYGLRWGEAWNYPKEPLDFFDIKGMVEMILEGLGISEHLKLTTADAFYDMILHPGKSTRVEISGKNAGIFGELHPDLKIKYELKRPAYVFELDADVLTEVTGRKKAYRTLPRFPESTRDIAFIADESLPYQEIISSIELLDTKLIERVELFDVYYGGNIPPGMKSLALRIVYRSKERTLTNQEVEELHSKVTAELVEKFNIEVRA